MVSINDRIGYISHSTIDGKTTFRFHESKISSIRNTKSGIRVRSPFFQTPLDAEELEQNTAMIKPDCGLILVREPFITTPELSEYLERVVAHWNKYGAKSLLDELVGISEGVEKDSNITNPVDIAIKGAKTFPELSLRQTTDGN